MWSQLLPRCVGGTIVDRDDPLRRATPIVGFELTRTHVYLLTPAWKFGGDRRMFHVVAASSSAFQMRGPGLSAIVTMPMDDAVKTD